MTDEEIKEYWRTAYCNEKHKKEELEQENTELKTKKIPQLERKIASIRGSHSVDAKKLKARTEQVERLKKENAELKLKLEVLEGQTPWKDIKDKSELIKENKELKEGLAVGSTWNKHLNSLNKELEEERDKYRNMVFDKGEQLTKARELLKRYVRIYVNPYPEEETELRNEAEQFLKENVE